MCAGEYCRKGRLKKMNRQGKKCSMPMSRKQEGKCRKGRQARLGRKQEMRSRKGRKARLSRKSKRAKIRRNKNSQSSFHLQRQG